MKRDGRGKLKGKRNRREGARQRQWDEATLKYNLELMYSCQPWAVGGK